MSKKKKLTSLEELGEVAAKGELKLADDASTQPPASQPAFPKLLPPAPGSGKSSSGPAETRAGVREYDEFFRLYAQSFAGQGLEFWPLGFIPGPALVLYGGDLVVAATPDVASGLPRLPVSWDQLPERVRQAMEPWAALFQALGFAPTLWNTGQAKRLLSGCKPEGAVVLGMPRFRYRGGDKEVAFGVVLEPTEDGMKVERVYNPHHVPDCPFVGAVLKLQELQDGRGPVHKLLRTWALMEANFASRYHRDGTPRLTR